MDPMKYMFLLFNEPADAAAWESEGPPSEESMAPWIRFGEEAARLATEVSSAALQPPATATVVSVRNGETLLTDGPFVDTKEVLGGYYVFDCKDLDVATKLATMIPWATTGHIEVRPVMELA
jgi:hypothetical protein